MFDIEYKGGNTIVIATKKSKLVADPRLSVNGLKVIDAKGALSIATEARFASESKDVLLAIESPGEYEVGDFSIKGVAAQRHIDSEGFASTMYRIEIGDVRIALLGNIDGKLSEEQLEGIGVVDMIILPVGGGGYTLDATSAAHIVRQIDAKIIVPIHYAAAGLKYEVPQDEFEVFHREIGGEIESVDKLKVKSASLLPSVLTIYKLTRS